MKFGELTVIRLGEPRKFNSANKVVTWVCKCSCGKEITVIGSNLKKVKSCGCKNHSGKNLIDLTGKKFGLLEVIERDRDRILPSGQHQTMWKCLCECGSVVSVRSAHLIDGSLRSCGCVKSHGEYNIAKYLSENGINFERQKTFSDCKYNKNGLLRFDFALYNNDKELKCLIEYQGKQHFEPPKNNEEFGKVQREITDKIKKDYCEKNHIKLFEIAYYENIEEKLEEIINLLYDNTVPSSLCEKV